MTQIQLKLVLGINPIGLSDPATLLILLPCRQLKKWLGINSMVFSTPWDDSLDIIMLQPVKKWPGINPMGLSAPWADSLDIIAFQTAEINCQRLTKWALVPLGMALL